MIYYTGDLHLGHANVIQLCARPFQTVEEMDEALIANWNRRINAGDSVYILGDLALRTGPLEAHLRRLNGKKHLIVGNHDRRWLRRPELRGHFESVQPLLFLADGSRSCVLCHYPMMAWPHQRESYMVFGHIHNDTSAEFWLLIRQSPLMLNAGVDINHFMPVTLDELLENNARFKAAHGVTGETI